MMGEHEKASPGRQSSALTEEMLARFAVARCCLRPGKPILSGRFRGPPRCEVSAIARARENSVAQA